MRVQVAKIFRRPSNDVCGCVDVGAGAGKGDWAQGQEQVKQPQPAAAGAEGVDLGLDRLDLLGVNAGRERD
jgi:hypothetical protein